MTDEDMEEKLLEKQFAMLAEMSPDDWHLIADVWNWDERLDVLFWILRQPNCDRATARMLFWKGEPTGYDWEDCDEVMGQDPYAVAPMLRHIVQRFNTDGFPRDGLEFDIFQAKTGSHFNDDPEWADYQESVRKGVDADFAELASRSEQAGNPLTVVPAGLLVKYSPGRRINKLVGDHSIFERFPMGVDYDTGDFSYEA